MASVRHGPRSGSGRSDERIQAPTRLASGTGAGLKRETISDNLMGFQPRRPRQGLESSRPQAQASSLSRTPSSTRIPQVSSSSSSSTTTAAATTTRRTTLPRQPNSRPPLTHQDKPWGPGSGTSLGSVRSAPSVAASIPRPSSRPTEDPRQRPVPNVLRRKSSNLGQETAKLRSPSRSGSQETDSSSSIPRSVASPGSFSGTLFDRSQTESPAEIRMAMKVDLPTTNAQTVRIYPELDRYRDNKGPPAGSGSGIEVPYRLATHDLPPPTPLFSGTSSQLSGYSGSPSTRFSGSPGPGPYSRDTTPTTSISSHSPGLVAPLRVPPPRVRQNSPATTQSSRPPVTRRRAGSVPNQVDSISADPHGLAAVREALNSSSSNSTVRDGDRKGSGSTAAATKTTAVTRDVASEKLRKKRIETVAPSPPPRKSSQKFKKSRDGEESPSKPAREPAQPVMTSPALGRAHTATSAVTSPRATPPVRPSRDGTPDLQSQLGLPMPVVHSNLSSRSLSERRQSLPLGPSSRSAAGNTAYNNDKRSATPSAQLERPNQPIQSRLPVGREPTPAPRPDGGRSDGRRPSHSGSTASRTPSPNLSSFRTRFPLFTRRTKTAADVPAQAVDKKEKPVRKGPAAGTGHEGYGRVGMSHRRRSSSMARGVAGTMSSQESLDRCFSDDPFLLERMNPVVISGGEIVQNHNVGSDLSRTDSNQSLAPALSRTGSDVSLLSPGERTTLWPSPIPRGPATLSPSLGSRRPSDSSDSEALAMRSTLAFRRSIHKLKDGADQSAVRLPKPIVVRPPHGVTSPAITSYDTSIMSDDSAVETSADPARAVNAPVPATAAAKKLTKRAKSPRKWHFFGRSVSQPATTGKDPEPRKAATTIKVAPPKPAAFYTMMDLSEQEDTDVADVPVMLRGSNLLNAPSLPPPQNTQSPTTRRPSVSRATADDDNLKRAGVVESLDHQDQILPEPPLPQWTERPLVATPEPLRLTPTVPIVDQQPAARKTGRPSRLPQVGRIPKVVSARPEQTSPKSFSRPFNRISMQLPPPGSVMDTDSLAKGPSPPKSSTPEPLLETRKPNIKGPMFEDMTTMSDSRVRLSQELSPNLSHVMTEFLAFSPRKNSQSTSCTTTSTSSGMLSYADATAVVPAPNAPFADDEVWLEYDDLLEDETLKMPPSAGSSQGTPFYLEGYTKRLAKQGGQSLESPTFKQDGTRTVDNVHVAHKSQGHVEIKEAKEHVASSIYSTDLTNLLNEALETGVIPISSPFSVSEFVSGYGDGPNCGGAAQPAGAVPANGSSTAAAIAAVKRNSSSVTNSPRRRKRASDASGSSQLSEDTSPLSQVNLRVGSMTVSKWLTFGHVLFSPASDELIPEVGSLKRHSILVIDGLGNDDWSFYAAETYPAATFFNLSPRAPLPDDRKNDSGGSSSSSFPLSPPNHHQIQYISHLDKFPFAPESFTAVVYRFPAAAPESHYRNIISEARRVLKPGGYIELSILDLDLNNMGNRSRRVVRRLKERIHAVKPDTSLGSTADLLLRLLGRKGFSDIKSCRVGVPVASAVVASASASGSDAAGAARGPDGRKKKDERSLAEMMRDESPVADESITKMVAKVGRWWFSRCYESGAAAGPLGGSIWNDRALLSECEEWGTSLKLMVCHARVPDGRARVASI